MSSSIRKALTWGMYLDLLAVPQSSCNIYMEDGNKVFVKPSLHKYVNEPNRKEYRMTSVFKKIRKIRNISEDWKPYSHDYFHKASHTDYLVAEDQNKKIHFPVFLPNSIKTN